MLLRAWVTESVIPFPKHLWRDKIAAEDCANYSTGITVSVPRLANLAFSGRGRPNDRLTRMATLRQTNLLYRRVDLEDVVSAHLLAIEKAPSIGFDRYITGERPPLHLTIFLTCGRTHPPVVKRRFPDYEGRVRRG